MAAPASLPAALLVVKGPTGDRFQTPVHPLPFHIGRLAENHLSLRDSRISRRHARIVFEQGAYVIEDLNSRHGLYVNGARVARHPLRHGDRIGFGFEDSYELIFNLATPAASPLLAQAESGGGHLARLRAMLEVARALQASLSTDEVLAAVVEAALAVTGCERGYLLLRHGDELQVRVARNRIGPSQAHGELPVERLRQAMLGRADLFWIRPEEVGGALAIPLVRVRTAAGQHTELVSVAEDTVGLLYLETGGRAELSPGSRELLATLALEASTVLENARLLEQQWARQRMEEELRIARRIQESLLPRELPCSPWLCAAAGSLPSRQVGGDYYDLRPLAPGCYAVVMADVSGKGVGAALLAALLQGMFVAAPHTGQPMEEMLVRVNRFLLERTGGEQFATVFYGLLEENGRLRFVNAGHPPLLLLGGSGLTRLPARSLPLGMLEEAAYTAEELRLADGDRLILYTDGLTEARDAAGEFFGLERLEKLVARHRDARAPELYRTLLAALEEFSEGGECPDDIALLVLEYRRPAGQEGRAQARA
ncbi:MAG: SpoIIE family protein phosphatase [Bryobacteraceae bacterium]